MPGRNSRVRDGEIRRLLDDGRSGLEIAESFGVSPDLVYQRITRAGWSGEANAARRQALFEARVVVGAELRAARLAKGWTGVEFAELVGTSHSTLWNSETGHESGSAGVERLREWLAIAKALPQREAHRRLSRSPSLLSKLRRRIGRVVSASDLERLGWKPGSGASLLSIMAGDGRAERIAPGRYRILAIERRAA